MRCVTVVLHRVPSMQRTSGEPMQRIQLALNVADLDAAIDFYGKLFAAEPAKRRPGYANFALTEPALKLVLIENPDARGTGTAGALNHLGVEVDTSDDVSAATRRLAGEGLDTVTEEASACCYAVQDKVWVHDPDDAPWEVYTVLSDSAQAGDVTFGLGIEDASSTGSAPACCTGENPACVPAAATR